MARKPAEKVGVENVLRPGSVRMVDKAYYEAVKDPYLELLPDGPPGLTPAEIRERLILPEALFPGGSKAGWWAKAVQLDLEAKGLIVREQGSPVRLHKAGHDTPRR